MTFLDKNLTNINIKKTLEFNKPTMNLYYLY